MKFIFNGDKESIQKIIILIISFLFAIGLWFHTTSQETYEARFTIPVITKNLPENLVITKGIPDNISIRIRANGKELININSSIKKECFYSLDLSSISENSENFPLNEGNIFFPKEFPSINILSMQPYRIQIEVKEKHEKKVPVLADSVRINYKKEYIGVGDISLDPEKVTIIGAKDDLRRINFIQLKLVKLNNIKESINRLIPCDRSQIPTYMKVVPESVRITQEVEKTLTRKIAHVEVKVISPDKPADVDPKTATIVLSGPYTHVDNLRPRDIQVIINAKGLTSGRYEKKAQIKFPHKKMHLIEVKPKVFTVVIKKES